MPGVLKNQTVLKGSPLKLNCRVSTEEMFPIKWLKKVVIDEITEAKGQLSYIQLGADKYKVLQQKHKVLKLGLKPSNPRSSNPPNLLSFYSQRGSSPKTPAISTPSASSQQVCLTVDSMSAWSMLQVC